MHDVEMEIVKTFGQLSDRNDAPKFRLVKWNQVQKYDLRRWESDERPLAGIAIDEEDFRAFCFALIDAAKFECDCAPIKTVRMDRATVRIYHDFGGFGYSYNMEKKITISDWGYGLKIDLRPWKYDYSSCGKGITLTREEALRLIHIIIDEVLEDDTQSIEFEDFVVRSQIFRCNKNHVIETIRAVISVLRRDGETQETTVSAGYCKCCNCYFILERDYLNLRSIGYPLCRQISEKDYREKGDSLFDGSMLNPQSVLNQIGYNVNSVENLTRNQRQAILQFALETNLYTVPELCNFLNWLIKKNERQTSRNMSEAISKWSEDYKFVAEYKIGTRPMKGVKSIRGKMVF